MKQNQGSAPERAIFALILVCSAQQVFAAELLDIAPSGQLTSWNGADSQRLRSLPAAPTSNVGIEWDEERDVREIHAGLSAKGASVEYWFKNWPYEPPRMPSFEDPMDDPWQGRWVKAAVVENCDSSGCVYRFAPLAASENALAKNLPDVTYRRTLKVRLVYPAGAPQPGFLRVFSGSEEKSLKLRVEMGANDSAADWSGTVSVYNGLLQSRDHWSFRTSGGKAEALALAIVAAKPDMPGSHDATVVTVHALREDASGKTDRSFSFAVDDLRHGPISIPSLFVRVVDPEQPSIAPAPTKLRIRERILREPEQSYERASREIPPLDPWDREWGGRVYLPLAPDSNWQKFAFEYGGNVFVSKTGIKAKGRELKRLQWDGDRIDWKLGTGATPYYREDHKVTVHKLDGYLPVIEQRWESDGLYYSEEAFSTVLRGPLSPQDAARDEETPAILMLRLSARNPSGAPRKAHVWLSVDAAGALTLDGNSVRGGGKLVARVVNAPGAALSIDANRVHITFDVPAGQDAAMSLKLPCVSDLDASDIDSMDRLTYSGERARVVEYWKKIVEPAVRFKVPEPKFNLLAKTVVVQIHISTTKDPKTGMYIVPAASYAYDAFPNESCYQILLLDTLGQFDTATAYLETMLRLQGTKNFPGAHKGPTDAIFHGSKIDDTYDYTASGYGLDHGTILWTLAEHYRYTRDRAWFAHAWPHMKKAIAWVEAQRATTMLTDLHGDKVREYGLLPASQLEDNSDWANWFSVNAYSWAGMSRSAEALEEIGSPEAAGVRKQADEFRADLRNAVLRAVESAPVARMQDGTYEPYVPVLPTRRFRLFGEIRASYYDRYGQSGLRPLMRLGADRDTLCGAVVLLILGVFSANEPIANWILNDWEDNETLSSGMGMNIHGMTDDRYWFSQGGMVFQANLVNPIQVYLKRHEAQAAIRNLYNDFVACLYPEVNMFTEEFHQWRHGSGPFYKISDESRFVNRVRDVLVMEDGDTLWLAPGAPRRWLNQKEGIQVKEVQTYFGPLSYTIHAGANTGTIEATVDLPSRNPAKQAWLVTRVPSGHIRGVTLNGKPWTRIDASREAIELPQQSGRLNLEIHYQ